MVHAMRGRQRLQGRQGEYCNRSGGVKRDGQHRRHGRFLMYVIDFSSSLHLHSILTRPALQNRRVQSRRGAV